MTISKIRSHGVGDHLARPRWLWRGALTPSTHGGWSAQLLDQVDLVVPAGVGGRATAFLVAEAGIKTGRLKGVGTQSHLIAAAAAGLLLGGGHQPGPQAGPAMVAAHPKKLNVATAAPRPAEQPCAQVTAPFSGYKSRMGRKIGMPAVNLYTEVPNVFFAEA